MRILSGLMIGHKFLKCGSGFHDDLHWIYNQIEAISPRCPRGSLYMAQLRRVVHSECRYQLLMEWDPELNKKENASGLFASISLCLLTMDEI